MLLHFQYYDTELDLICSDIFVDWDKKTVSINNHTDDIELLPFGVNTNPSYEDFVELLFDRCFPPNRDDAFLLLQDMGIDRYDPLQIIFKTKGFMWEDKCEFRYVGDINEVKHLYVT